MSIGQVFSSTVRTFTDTETGRMIRQFTSAPANSYPLYYFIPSITPDNRYLILHSERTGWVQLYRLDLASGEMVQLTDGRTRDAGWAIWCEARLRGVYNHLSALNEARREVYYFQDDELRITHIDTLENRRIHTMPGRIPIGQSGFSPDGRHFAFIHADRDHFHDRHRRPHGSARHAPTLRPRSLARNCALYDQSARHGKQRVCRNVIDLDYHVHHVFFLDNHQPACQPRARRERYVESSTATAATNQRTLRPNNWSRCGLPPGDHRARGHLVRGERRGATGSAIVWFGHYRPGDRPLHREMPLPGVGYVHSGRDPAGEFLCVENQGRDARIAGASTASPKAARSLTRRLLRRLSAYPRPVSAITPTRFWGPDRPLALLH
jgi:hypothetical protein